MAVAESTGAAAYTLLRVPHDVVGDRDDTPERRVRVALATIPPLEHLALCRSSATTFDATCFTGMRVYEGADVLSAFIASPQWGGAPLFENTRICEIGCGCGLAGVTAILAGRPREVTFTDGERAVLELVAETVEGMQLATVRSFDASCRQRSIIGGAHDRGDSEPSPQVAPGSSSATSSCDVNTAMLRWDVESDFDRLRPFTDDGDDSSHAREAINESSSLTTSAAGRDLPGRFDVVVGSELVYFRTYFGDLARACARLLAPRGLLIVCFVERVAHGCRDLALALHEAGIAACRQLPLDAFLHPSVIASRQWGKVQLWMAARSEQVLLSWTARTGNDLARLRLIHTEIAEGSVEQEAPDADLPLDW